MRTPVTAGKTRGLRWRLEALQAMHRLLAENEGELSQALSDDLGKDPAESLLTEVGLLRAEVRHIVKHLSGWIAPKNVAVPLLLQPATARTVLEPKGVILVMGAWNYPIQLTLDPVIGALAAGNAVVMKPSELAPASSAVIARLIPEYFAPDVARVVEGDADVATELLAMRWDHIVYTGGDKVASIIAEAAAKHLTPVTLELGGKSPVWVDESADLKVAANRIVWGKFMNSGQTCVAPDYLMCTDSVAEKLVPLLREAAERMYGSPTAKSPFWGKIINNRHLSRLKGLIPGQGSSANDGGAAAEGSMKLSAQIIDDATLDSPAMQEEIFGPILPVVRVSGVDEAISVITCREKPLALYVFARSASVRRRFEQETSSGALNFGIPSAHLLVPGLPFGGVGNSGYGSYHGEHSVREFSHAKAVLSKPSWPDTLALVYPPFTTTGLHAATRAAIKYLLR